MSINLRDGKELRQRIQEGDIVYLKGLKHRPLMFVQRTDTVSGEHASCIWFNTNFDYQEKLFLFDMLEVYKDEKLNSSAEKTGFTYSGINLDDFIENPNFIEAYLGGRKIECIKIVRNAVGTGLKESKDFIDAIPEQYKLRMINSRAGWNTLPF